MELSEITAITGKPGLFKVAARKNDGLIVTSLVDGKTEFVAGRTHLFTMLDNITIYTTGEPVTLKETLAAIKAAETKNPLPDAKDDAAVKAWLEKVLPTYDKEKVYASDMKKLLKWYIILNDKNLIEELTSDKPAEEAAESKEETTEKGEKGDKKEPKKETKAKDTKPKVSKKDTSGKAKTKSAPVKKITTPRKAS